MSRIPVESQFNFGRSNCQIVPIKAGSLFVSYQTPVGAIINGAVFITTEKYSKTTSKQVSEFWYQCRKAGYIAFENKPAQFFAELASNNGLTAGRAY